MLAYIGRRLAFPALLLIGTSIIVFGIMQLLPGDAADLMLGAWSDRTGASFEALRRQLGLDLAWYQQYGSWLWGLLHWDFGRGLAFDAPAAPVLFERLAASLRVAAPALLPSAALSLSLAIISAVRRCGVADLLIGAAVLCGVSLPAFVTGSLLILVFSGWLGWFPSSSSVEEGQGIAFWATGLALAVATLTIESLAHVTRTARGGMIEVLRSPYVEAARLKGLRSGRILWRHVLLNADSHYLHHRHQYQLDDRRYRRRRTGLQLSRHRPRRNG